MNGVPFGLNRGEREAVSILPATGDATSPGTRPSSCCRRPSFRTSASPPLLSFPLPPPFGAHSHPPTRLALDGQQPDLHSSVLPPLLLSLPLLPHTPLLGPPPFLYSHPPGWPLTATGPPSARVMWPECICKCRLQVVCGELQSMRVMRPEYICTCALQPYRWWWWAVKSIHCTPFCGESSKVPSYMAMFESCQCGRSEPAAPHPPPHQPQVGSQHPRCDALPPAICCHHHTEEG